MVGLCDPPGLDKNLVRTVTSMLNHNSTTERDDREQRRTKVLEAGAAAVGAADYEWSSGLTYDYLEEVSGVNRRQIDRDFGSKQGFVSALISYILRVEAGVGTEMDLAFDIMSAHLQDRSVPLAESLSKIGLLLHKETCVDPQLRAEIALACFSDRDETIRQGLHDLHDPWERGTENMVHRFLESDTGIKPRRGLTAAEFAKVMSVLTAGLAMRARLDPDAVSDDLLGRILTMLIGSWVTVDDALASAPIGSELVEFDRRRQASP